MAGGGAPLPRLGPLDLYADRVVIDDRHWDTLLSWCSPEFRREPWLHSPPEAWKVGGVVAHLGRLASFKRSIHLSGGTLNPPDRPKTVSLDDAEPYDDARPSERLRNSLLLLRRLIATERHSLRHGHGWFPHSHEVRTGEMRGVSIPCNLLTDLSIRMSYYRHRLLHLATTAPRASRTYLEIGAGFGALARYVLSDRRSRQARFVICDLPEFLPVCYWYLCASGISVAPLGDTDADSARVVLTTGAGLPSVGAVDVAINTMSFQHMTRDNINYYLGQIDRLGAEAVFLVNRDELRDPTDVPISQYSRPSRYRVELDHVAWSGRRHREQVWRRDSA